MVAKAPDENNVAAGDIPSYRNPPIVGVMAFIMPEVKPINPSVLPRFSGGTNSAIIACHAGPPPIRAPPKPAPIPYTMFMNNKALKSRKNM